jgi:hypothetical protein
MEYLSSHLRGTPVVGRTPTDDVANTIRDARKRIKIQLVRPL